MLAIRAESPSGLGDDWECDTATCGIDHHGQKEVCHGINKQEGHEENAGVMSDQVSFPQLIWDVLDGPDDGSYVDHSVEVGQGNQDEGHGHSKSVYLVARQILLQLTENTHGDTPIEAHSPLQLKNTRVANDSY